MDCDGLAQVLAPQRSGISLESRSANRRYGVSIGMKRLAQILSDSEIEVSIGTLKPLTQNSGSQI